MKNIERLVKETDFVFEVNEIGFGRACVGIFDPRTECYVSYNIKDDRTHKTIAEHTAEVPEHAYHKGPYLAVLSGDIGEKAATAELDAWVGHILDAGYQVQEFVECGTIAALIEGGSIRQKAIVNAKQDPLPVKKITVCVIWTETREHSGYIDLEILPGETGTDAKRRLEECFERPQNWIDLVKDHEEEQEHLEITDAIICGDRD